MACSSIESWFDYYSRKNWVIPFHRLALPTLPFPQSVINSSYGQTVPSKTLFLFFFILMWLKFQLLLKCPRFINEWTILSSTLKFSHDSRPWSLKPNCYFLSPTSTLNIPVSFIRKMKVLQKIWFLFGNAAI